MDSLHTVLGWFISRLHRLVSSFHHGRLAVSSLIMGGMVTATFTPSLVSPSAAATPARTFSTLAAARQVGQGYTPAQIQTAYGIQPLLSSGLNGAGQTIALVELDSFDPTDIHAFDVANNLPDPVVQETYVGGKTFRLTNQGETTMDLEWAHALAPGAKIQIYYVKGQQANAAGWQSVGQAVTSAIASGATSISLSFGTCNPSTGYRATSTALAAALAHGVSVFVSSGDTGDLAGPVRECGRQPSVGYPASDPSVVSVGGTSLLLNNDNTQYSQFAWSLSGGGKAKPMLRPTWQVTPNLRPGKYRYVPDVSFLANPQTGAEIFYNGDWQTAGGTSLGAPAWAAIWTLVKASAAQSGKTVGAAPTYLYQIGNSNAYSSAFTDITSGSNGAYGAKPGWDAVTGWGTPQVSGLAVAVASIVP